MDQCQITSNYKEIRRHSFFSVRVIVSHSILLVVLFMGVLYRRVHVIFLLNAWSLMEQCQNTYTHLIFSSWFCFSLSLSRVSIYRWATLSSLRIFSAKRVKSNEEESHYHKSQKLPINIPFLVPGFVPYSIFSRLSVYGRVASLSLCHIYVDVALLSLCNFFCWTRED